MDFSPINGEKSEKADSNPDYLGEAAMILQLLYKLYMPSLLILWVNLWHKCVDPSHLVRVSPLYH